MPALKVGRAVVGAALVIGLGAVAMTALTDDSILVELSATSPGGPAAGSWSVGPANGDFLVGPHEPWRRQFGAKPGDLMLVIVRSAGGGITNPTCMIAYVGRPGRPKASLGNGHTAECKEIAKR